MTGDSKIEEFPDIGSKLTAPTKKSIFERQKAEAEAKRQREQAETAAVYEDFVKSFEDNDDPSVTSGGGLRPGIGGSSGTLGSGPGFGGPSKRHFTGTPTGPATGGGLGGSRGGSGPGSLGPPPPSLSRKRAYDGTQASQRDNTQGLFAFENSAVGPVDAATAFRNSDEDDEKTASGQPRERSAPKPTLHLSSLPPGSSPALIKSLFPPALTIDNVRILPPPGAGTLERRSFSAIVTLAKDTTANDIEAAVNSLQNQYLGWGFYLSLSRHLSSAALNAGIPVIGGTVSAKSSLPFGARPIPTGPGGGLNRAPPAGMHRGGYAPPSSYAPTGPGQYGRGAPPLQVNVNPPSDLKQLKLIHKTLEALLTHGPEFEALLMSRADVQKEEKWAWLWDPRSAGGVWYRWRLWEILTGSQHRSGYGYSQNKRMPQHVFDGGASWLVPERRLRFEYTTALDEFVSDSEYDSSEDEDSGDEGGRQRQQHRGRAPSSDATQTGADGDGRAYLNPLQKAKLTHLLARLPTTNAKLRKGDIARVTAFAIQHAGEGADEVVDLIVFNIEQPLNFTSANTERTDNDGENGEDNESRDKGSKENEDTSSSKLIGLYLVSDILSSSSTSGVRHAWRYRQLFEAALKQKKVFEHLGRLDKEMQWGRLRAEKWKRSVGSVLTLWEGWCVFPQASQEHFVDVFTNPPLTPAEEAAAAAAEKASAAASAAKSKWKTVDVKAQQQQSLRPDLKSEIPPDDPQDMDVDGEPMLDEDEDIDGEPMDDDDDVDGEPMEGPESGDQVEQEDDEGRDHPLDQRAIGFNVRDSKANDASKAGEKSLGKRRRPKAEDMFADSDEE
ncbi:hypothetical protein MMC16_000205 [Acarospora aff. strigata]|nr:hypothetical protein [Acarospora aff. strigata]